MDGESHFVNKKTQQKDFNRDKDLEKQNIKILRFLNPEVMKNLEGVLSEIAEEIKKRK